MIRILFVDDESRVLDGLKRVLRPHRGDWDMRFAPGGAAALAELERGPADLVVSDLRMPEMDGVALLERVRQRFPAAARVLLTGQTDLEAGIHAMRSAQQFLTKPCEQAPLIELTARIARLAELLPDPALRAAAGSVASLPWLPASRTAIERAIAVPAPAPAALARILERDPALAARVLQLASSAFFSRPRAIGSVEEAVEKLGIDVLRTLVTSGALFEGAVRAQIASGVSLESWHAACVEAADAARAACAEPDLAEPRYLGGLFGGIGSLFSGPATPVSIARRGAAYLLGLWGVPWSIVDATVVGPEADAGDGEGAREAA